MSSNGDSTSGGARAQKRSAIPSLCTDANCAAFQKTLGNGYCKDCCFSRGVHFKAPKIPKQPAVVDDSVNSDNVNAPENQLLSPAVVDDSDDVNASGPKNQLLSPDFDLHAKVLVCSDDVCVIGRVSAIWREKKSGCFFYSVKNDDAVVIASKIAVCHVHKYMDSEDYPSWPRAAHPIRTLVHGSSRSIGSSPAISNALKNITPFGNIHGVSVDSEGNPLHYFVLCAEEAKPIEGRVLHASDVVVFEQAPTPSSSGTNDYQKILQSLPANHFAEGSPVRDDLLPKKKTSPKKTESQVLQADTNAANATFTHRSAHQACQISSTVTLGSVSQQPSASPFPEHLEDMPSLEDIVWLQLGIDVEERYISDDMGYGMFMLREIPNDCYVTTYDGPRVDCRTGEVILECPFTYAIESKYIAEKKFIRSRKWGDYEREHCVLLEHSNDVCIDGTFSSQPFLFSEGFHGGTGFGANFNSGRGEFVNMKKFYIRSSRFPYDPSGQLHLVRSVRASFQ